MSHIWEKWEKSGQPAWAGTRGWSTPENSSDIDRNRPGALEECIDDPLSSKNSLRTSWLSEQVLAVPQLDLNIIKGIPANLPTTPPSQLSIELWVWTMSGFISLIYLYRAVNAPKFISPFIVIGLKLNRASEMDRQCSSKGLPVRHATETLWPRLRSISVSWHIRISWPPHPEAASVWSMWSDFKVGTRIKLGERSVASGRQII